MGLGNGWVAMGKGGENGHESEKRGMGIGAGGWEKNQREKGDGSGWVARGKAGERRRNRGRGEVFVTVGGEKIWAWVGVDGFWGRGPKVVLGLFENWSLWVVVVMENRGRKNVPGGRVSSN
ncbi:unnamed protein product [Prunus armeniaca]